MCSIRPSTKGCRLLKDNGILGFIASNKWLRINYGEPLRRYLVSKMNPLLLIDFPGVPVFEDATVDPQILIVGKQKYSGCTQACAIKKHQESLSEYIPRHSITTSWQLIIHIRQRTALHHIYRYTRHRSCPAYTYHPLLLPVTWRILVHGCIEVQQSKYLPDMP